MRWKYLQKLLFAFRTLRVRASTGNAPLYWIVEGKKFHPGEFNMKEMRCQINTHQSDLNKLVEEFESKKGAVQRMKDKVQNRIESDLFQLNRAAYLANDNKNWSLLHKHVYFVEEYLKKKLRRKIPGKQDIWNILEKALTDNNWGSLAFSRSKQSGSHKRENPAKPSLERHGIEFPSSKHACRTCTRTGSYCDIFNELLRDSFVPDPLKQSIVIPVPKVSPLQKIHSDLRPISLTNSVAKILKGFTNRRLVHQVGEYIDPK